MFLQNNLFHVLEALQYKVRLLFSSLPFMLFKGGCINTVDFLFFRLFFDNWDLDYFSLLS